MFTDFRGLTSVSAGSRVRLRVRGDELRLALDGRDVGVIRDGTRVESFAGGELDDLVGIVTWSASKGDLGRVAVVKLLAVGRT